MELKYKRIVLKVSGEALAGELGYGISPDVVQFVAGEIEGIHAPGGQVAAAGGRSAIWRRVAWSSSWAGPAIRTFPRTRRRRSGPSRSGRRWSSRRRRWTGSIRRTR